MKILISILWFDPALPIIVTNAVLFLMLGPSNFLRFMDKQFCMLQSPYLWIGNHSALSFTQMVLVPLGVSSRWAHLGAVGLPAGMWLIGAFLLWKRGYRAWHAILLFALSVPLMCVIPGTSHDYKLVILYAPCLMLIAGLLFNYIQAGRWRDMLMIGVLLIAMGFVSRSFYLVSIGWLKNKYPFILMIQVITFLIILFPRGVFKTPICRNIAATGGEPTRNSGIDGVLARLALASKSRQFP